LPSVWSSAAASSGAVDLNLEGGHSRVDFDMFGQTRVDPQAQAVELDFSDVFDEKDAEATIVSDESLDFQFDDPQRGSDLLPEDTVTNLEPVLKLPVELDIALDDDEENGAAGHLDRTAELAIDDLDLGHMDPTDSQRIDDSRVARALESNVDLLEAERERGAAREERKVARGRISKERVGDDAARIAGAAPAVAPGVKGPPLVVEEERVRAGERGHGRRNAQ
jgi:hypothetical protein